MTGTELKLRRVAAHRKAKDVAQAAGWSPWKISRLESLAYVSQEDADRYVAALLTLTTKSAPGTSAA